MQRQASSSGTRRTVSGGGKTAGSGSFETRANKGSKVVTAGSTVSLGGSVGGKGGGLFKALTNYVDPKVQLEEGRLTDLRSQKSQAGSTGSTARQAERAIERQEALMAELRDFRDKLNRAASLGLKPDLDDGVVLNAAPLWELMPWKVAKDYWQELLKGEYAWSSISKQLRAKNLVAVK